MYTPYEVRRGTSPSRKGKLTISKSKSSRKFQPSVKYILKKKDFSTFLPIQIYKDAKLTLPYKGQRSTYVHHLNKLGKAWNSDALYQDSAPKLSRFWRRYLKTFTSLWTGRPSCLMARNNLNKLVIPFRQKEPYEIWWKLRKQFLRRHLIIHNSIHVYSLGERVDNPQGTKFCL